LSDRHVNWRRWDQHEASYGIADSCVIRRLCGVIVLRVNLRCGMMVISRHLHCGGLVRKNRLIRLGKCHYGAVAKTHEAEYHRQDEAEAGIDSPKRPHAINLKLDLIRVSNMDDI
jgi:hypothetical protein